MLVNTRQLRLELQCRRVPDEQWGGATLAASRKRLLAGSEDDTIRVRSEAEHIVGVLCKEALLSTAALSSDARKNHDRRRWVHCLTCR